MKGDLIILHLLGTISLKKIFWASHNLHSKVSQVYLANVWGYIAIHGPLGKPAFRVMDVPIGTLDEKVLNLTMTHRFRVTVSIWVWRSIRQQDVEKQGILKRFRFLRRVFETTTACSTTYESVITNLYDQSMQFIASRKTSITPEVK